MMRQGNLCLRPITNEGECQRAAKALSLVWAASYYQDGDHPGCMFTAWHGHPPYRNKVSVLVIIITLEIFLLRCFSTKAPTLEIQVTHGIALCVGNPMVTQ